MPADGLRQGQRAGEGAAEVALRHRHGCEVCRWPLWQTAAASRSRASRSRMQQADSRESHKECTRPSLIRSPMRFPPSLLDEIRARLPVSQVVARKVALKRAGREMKGLSPFKQEKTPSFFVNDHKGSWFDFSSGQNGDIFKFVMLTEGLSFPEAVERLAEEAGLPMPKASPREAEQEDERARLYALLEAAAPLLRGAAGGGRSARRRAAISTGAGSPPTPSPASAWAMRPTPLGAEGAPGQGRLHGGRDGGLGHADRGRRHPGRLRPLPPSRHVSRSPTSRAASSPSAAARSIRTRPPST